MPIIRHIRSIRLPSANMGQVVQFLDILGRIVSDGLQLIEQPPETDRRMIIMLANQFFQLLFPVLPERRLVDVALVLG